MANNSKRIEYRLRNAGFSMIELMVVVAIMAVLAGIGVATYSTVTRTNVKKAAVVVDNMMSECRQKAKAKATTNWAIRMDYSEKGSPICAIYQGDSLTAYSTQTLASVVALSISYPDSDAEGNASKITVKVGADEETCDAQYVGISYVALSGKIASVSLGKIDNTETVLPERDYYDFTFTRNTQVYTIRLYRSTGKQEMTDGTFADE